MSTFFNDPAGAIRQAIQAVDLSHIYKVKIGGRWLTGSHKWCENQRDLAKVRGQRPSLVVLAHPECEQCDGACKTTDGGCPCNNWAVAS